MLGANDLLQGCEPEKAAERGLPISCLRWICSTEKILWIAPPPFAFGEWVQSQKMIDDSAAFAQFCLAQAAEQNIRCLDAGRWGVTMAYDGVHFTEQGHRALAEGLYKGDLFVRKLVYSFVFDPAFAGFVACGKNSASGMAADSQAADKASYRDDHPGKAERTYGYKRS